MESLIDKYRPQAVKDLVLPTQHSISAALNFCRNPYPSAWLLHGKPGLGKTSLATIMGQIASESPLALQTFSGPDVNIELVRDLAASFTSGCLFGRYHTVVINECDSMPAAAQIRFLDILDRLKQCKTVVICTSNDDLASFEERFLSRVRPQLFTSQGLANPARDWLQRVADQEGIPLTAAQAARIVKLSKNNLRAALQGLEVHSMDQLADSISATDAGHNRPQPCFQTGGRAAPNRRQTAPSLSRTLPETIAS